MEKAPSRDDFFVAPVSPLYLKISSLKIRPPPCKTGRSEPNFACQRIGRPQTQRGLRSQKEVPGSASVLTLTASGPAVIFAHLAGQK